MKGAAPTSGGGGGSRYEEERERRIADNKRRLAELGIPEAAEAMRGSTGGGAAPKRQKTRAGGSEAGDAPAEPPRRSGRQRREVSYAEPSMQEVLARAPAAAPEHEPPPEYDPPAACAARVEPAFDASEGTRDAQGRLVFSDHPEFRPNLTPRQVIQAGSFGGIYFNPRGGKPGLKPSVDVTHTEFPAAWFEGLAPGAYRGRTYTVARNKYGVKAGQDQAFWEGKGWIREQDPRGWFQWYCRFYEGRRSDDDVRQISRWRGVVGDKGRWVRALVNKIVRSNKRCDDATVSPVIRQTLLHWAFELTQAEFERMRRQL